MVSPERSVQNSPDNCFVFTSCNVSKLILFEGETLEAERAKKREGSPEERHPSCSGKVLFTLYLSRQEHLMHSSIWT